MKVIKCTTQEEIMDNVMIRGNVFIVGQNIEWELEFDGLDKDCSLYVAYIDKIVVGAARLYHNKVGRLATLSTHRNKGIASALMALIEKDAKENGIELLKLNAQLYIADFYLKRGYHKQGETFFEAGIEHIHMTKEI